jgi:hypothetical protein
MRTCFSPSSCRLVLATSAVLAQACVVAIDGDTQPSHDDDLSDDVVPDYDPATPVEPMAADHCLAGITDYAAPGPFTFARRSGGPLGLVKMWVPDLPEGCKVPMVHLANGTGAFCDIYAPSLERLASHGFLALCFESPITGAGHAGMTAFETALAELPDLADLRFGSTGHSQGGMGALVTQRYAEEKWGNSGIYAGLAMQPASGFGAQPIFEGEGLWPEVYSRIKSPVFMFSGWITDGLVPEPWVALAYLALDQDTEVYYWAKLSTHIPVPNDAEMQISIPWFRWKLLGDRDACEYFQQIPSQDLTWQIRAEKNAQPCSSDGGT